MTQSTTFLSYRAVDQKQKLAYMLQADLLHKQTKGHSQLGPFQSVLKTAQVKQLSAAVFSQ